jgi:hypothetical protein
VNRLLVYALISAFALGCEEEKKTVVRTDIASLDSTIPLVQYAEGGRWIAYSPHPDHNGCIGVPGPEPVTRLVYLSLRADAPPPTATEQNIRVPRERARALMSPRELQDTVPDGDVLVFRGYKEQPHGDDSMRPVEGIRLRSGGSLIVVVHN